MMIMITKDHALIIFGYILSSNLGNTRVSCPGRDRYRTGNSEVECLYSQSRQKERGTGKYKFLGGKKEPLAGYLYALGF